MNNPAIFGNLGNIGKNTYRLPRTSGWDVQLSKYILVHRTLEAATPGRVFQRPESPQLRAREHKLHGPCATDQISSFDKLNGNSASAPSERDRERIPVSLSLP